MIFNKKKKKVKKKQKSEHHLIEDGVHLLDDGIKAVKTRISLFYKLHFISAILFSLLLFYYLVLVPIKPISVPYIKNKINSSLKENLGGASLVEDAQISFTYYGALQISVLGFKSDVFDKKDDNRDIVIPEIELFFPLYKLLIFKISPNKIVVDKMKIIFSANNKVENEENLATKKFEIDYAKFISSVSAAFDFIHKKGSDVKGIEIKNTQIIYKNKNEKIADLKFLIKRSRINLKYTGLDHFNVNASTMISVNENEKNILVTNDCELEKGISFGCVNTISKITVSDFADNCENCKMLKNINSEIAISSSFLIKDGPEYFNFNVKSDDGSFILPNIFAKKIHYKNFELFGEYDLNLDNLRLSNIESFLYFSDNIKSNKVLEEDLVKISMSYGAQGFLNNNYRDSKINIGLKNVSGKNIAKLWPLNLGKKIRAWLTKNMTGGIVTEASVDFNIVNNDEKNELTDLDAKLEFEKINLNYSQKFPEIKDITGTASFSKEGMDIVILEAKALNSNITNSKVSIKDFKNPILEINANLNGDASDGLRHANYNSESFKKEAQKYLNGNSISNVKIEVPLNKEITLNSVNLNVVSKVLNAKSQYFEGELDISVKKPENSLKFVSEVNLNNSKVKIDELSIYKKKNVQSKLKAAINFAEKDVISVEDIYLYHVLGKNVKERLSGKIKYSLKDTRFNYVNLKNNFGRNNYHLYFLDKSKKRQNYVMSLRGSSLDLSGFLNNKKKSDKKLPSYKLYNFSGFAKLSKIYLANNKFMRNFYLNAKCYKKICRKLDLKSDYTLKKLPFINVFVKNEKNNLIVGRVKDVGYLTEALAISKQISFGDAKIEIKQGEKDSEHFYKGEVNIDNKIVFYDNPYLKKFEKDDLYSKVKDKIFSDGKTVFGKMKIDFSGDDRMLFIDRFIANNYKIGITAKGKFDISNNSFDFKGMIIPGFLINNLFGIGKIPIIGNVISGLLTGGEGGGLFGLKFEYKKSEKDKEAIFKTFPVSSFVPVSIRNLFEAI